MQASLYMPYTVIARPDLSFYSVIARPDLSGRGDLTPQNPPGLPRRPDASGLLATTIRKGGDNPRHYRTTGGFAHRPPGRRAGGFAPDPRGNALGPQLAMLVSFGL